jgi:hypothetical protein
MGIWKNKPSGNGRMPMKLANGSKEIVIRSEVNNVGQRVI